jgi:hypothetical protein
MNLAGELLWLFVLFCLALIFLVTVHLLGINKSWWFFAGALYNITANLLYTAIFKQ